MIGWIWASWGYGHIGQVRRLKTCVYGCMGMGRSSDGDMSIGMGAVHLCGEMALEMPTCAVPAVVARAQHVDMAHAGFRHGGISGARWHCKRVQAVHHDVRRLWSRIRQL